jgi:hypothetical protein
MSDPITSARVRKCVGSPATGVHMVIRDPSDIDRIAKALDLLERVEAGDAGLVEAMIEAAGWALFGNYEPGSDDPFRVAEEVLRAALAALVGEEVK